MRTKILLFLSLLTCGVLKAQVDDTIRTLIITEVRLDDARRGYVEIANVGSTTINLSQFEIGRIDAWTAPWTTGSGNWMMLPNKDLDPGQTFILAVVREYALEMFKLRPEEFDPLAGNKSEFWTLADIQIHADEVDGKNPAGDSIAPAQGRDLLTVWSGRDCIYLRHHVGEDSTVIDQVNGIWGGGGSTRPDPKGAVDVAGVKNATSATTLVRKFSVTEGELDFANTKGEDLTESQWIPIPHQANGRWADNVRRLFWTAGFHGNAVLSETTLDPIIDEIEVNWAAKTITVPWGVRRDDSVMFKFVKVPGLAWHYDYVASYSDSAYVSARTGDSLTVYATGNELTSRKFGIVVTPPTDDAKIVVPKKAPNGDGFYDGQDDPPYTVSDGLEMDTIATLRFGGLAFATRVDTLFKYLEKPEAASWEIEWVDGNERTDLMHGDVLKVTANDNSEKRYFIKLDVQRKSHNAYLSAITWPDMPEEDRGLYGWLGDTIPNFITTKNDYVVQLPSYTQGVPALVAKNQGINGKHTVIKATNLDGGIASSTVTFTSIAEDDTSKEIYTVQMLKIKDPNDIQPWDGEAFISEWVFWEQWSGNNWIEVVNPRGTEMDMSNYMFVVTWENNPASAILTRSGLNPGGTRTIGDDWVDRYRRYIPGYKWEDSLSWIAEPSKVEPDLAVNPIVQPGDVFVIATITGGGNQPAKPNWWAANQADVILSPKTAEYPNPWGEHVGEGIAHWKNANIYMFRIDNDSIKQGLKAATDPDDFTLIDVLGNGDGTDMVMGGRTVDMIETYIRKPGVYQGNDVFKGSAGTTTENSEWLMRNSTYYNSEGWPNSILYITRDIGSHFMNDVTIYRSTITSSVYKVSPGYSNNESLRGIVAGTDLAGVFGNIIKVDPGQVLTIKRATDGSVLEVTDTPENGDTLIVKSADLLNTTKYVLEVTEEGLSSDAVLVSADWDITVDGEEGVVAGFDYGITLRDLVNKIEVPAGATFLITNETGAYVPFKMLNFDTTYVDVLANDKIIFEVIADNGINKITYSLEPNSSSSDAFVLSNVFGVDNNLSLIYLVPGGISVPEFLNNLIPAAGATIELHDKLGYLRLAGNIISDDTLVVTAADGLTIRKYGLQMLGGLTSDQIAYVISEVYIVDQIDFVIMGDIFTTISVADFKANLIASTGATVAVTNAAGTPKNSGNLEIGDLVKVISPNGSVIVTYTIDFATATNNSLNNNVVVYPNPSKGRYFISGISAGSRILVTNIVGSVVLEKQAVAERDEISIEKERSGFYFITIINGKEVAGRFKVVKE